MFLKKLLSPFLSKEKFVPWNKGRTVGQKKPLTLKQANKIKSNLERQNKLRDLALFSCAFDTMLRGVDLLSLKVSDVQDSNGNIRNEFFVRQKKTDKGIQVGLTPFSQNILKSWIIISELKACDFIFIHQRGQNKHVITTDHYRRLIKGWVKAIGLDPSDYSTHSMRRSKAVMIYEVTKRIDVIKSLLGHQSLSSTYYYLNTSHLDALKLAREFHFNDRLCSC